MNRTKKQIPAYVINLEKRADRREHVIREFEGRGEFSVRLVNAIEHNEGHIGLNLTVKKILEAALEAGHPYILLCEDDHVFTDNYSPASFKRQIRFAQRREADMLLGGVSWLTSPIKLPDALFRVEMFMGTQFVVLFRSYFKRLLEVIDLNVGSSSRSLDLCMTLSADNKYLVYPFISVQKDFGYSDATVQRDHSQVKVSQYFENTGEEMVLLNKLFSFYKRRKYMINRRIRSMEAVGDNLQIPVHTFSYRVPMRIW